MNIKEQCKEWVISNLGKDFTFRPNQLETIESTISNVLNNTKTQVLQAPTGSGKSLIAIIAAGVLWEYYEKKSYILVSDLSLFEQYEKDLERYNLDWGHIKGKDSYLCHRNGNPISSSDCSIAKVSFNQLRSREKAFEAGFGCATDCKYIQLKNKAAYSPITIMTYSFWLIQMNLVNRYSELKLFDKRDFVICDEAHKMCDIIQQHFSPRIDTSNLSFIETLRDYAIEHKMDVPSIEDIKLTAKTMHNVESPEDIMTCLKRLKIQYNAYAAVDCKVREKLKDKKNVTPELSKVLRAGNTMTDCICKVSDYMEYVEKIGLKTIVKTSTENEGQYIISLNSAYESYIVRDAFHNKADKELLMSATIGNINTFKCMIDMEKADDNDFKYTAMPPTFDYSKSPIYYTKKNRMSYSEKQKSLPLVVKEVIRLCNAYSMKRGIIQTGSYEFSSALYRALPLDIKKRILFYGNSKEKQDSINMFLKSTNRILIGPSLIEGLNFDGDKCRFAIVMKVPYASLGDKLVKAKMNLIPGWYQSDVCNKLEQSFGRGVRYDGDWCETYILDGCFSDLLKYGRTNFNKSTLSRLKEMK